MFFFSCRCKGRKKRSGTCWRVFRTATLVQTTGGMIGTIVSVENDTLVLRIKPDNLRIQIARSAIAGVISEKS